MQDGGDRGGALLAVDAIPEPPQLDIRMDKALLHCQACLLPLRPPLFKCEAAGHIVCCYCRAGHNNMCSRTTTHCVNLDAIVAAAKVPCPYRKFGCEQYVMYHGFAEHQMTCQSAPYACPEFDCAFFGSRDTLLDHFAAAHSRLAVTVRYGQSCNLSLSLAQSWHVLVGEEDKSVFLVSLGAFGGATAVSLVWVRANSAPATQFRCRLSVESPTDGMEKLVIMASEVGSTTLAGSLPAPTQGMFLGVPRELLSGAILALSIRIDTVPHAAPAPSSSQPGAV